MIINIRVDYTIADIQTMEEVSKDLNDLFSNLKNKFNLHEYIEINTCNRYEYYINCEKCDYNDEVLNHSNKNIIIEYDDEAILHLLKMTSGLESMIIGEDQILGQTKDAFQKAKKEGHVGKILETLFTKAIHVGQVVRNKTKINQGSVSIGSAAVDLAEEYLGDLKEKCVLVLGAGKMGTLVAKALAEKNLKAIFVANRTYYKAVRLAKELDGEAVLIDDIGEHFSNADVIITATGSPHPILTKERVSKFINDKPTHKTAIIDIANPRDVTEDIRELDIQLFNIDDLRGIADKNKKLRESEAREAMSIINEEFNLLKESFNLIEVNDMLGHLRTSMEEIRQREMQKGIIKMEDIDSKGIKTIDSMTKSIVNKIFHDLSKNIKKVAIEEDEELIKLLETIFKD